MPKFTREKDIIVIKVRRRKGREEKSRFCSRYQAFTCATRYYRKGSRMLLLGLSEDAFDSRRATWDLALKVLFAFLQLVHKRLERSALTGGSQLSGTAQATRTQARTAFLLAIHIYVTLQLSTSTYPTGGPRRVSIAPPFKR